MNLRSHHDQPKLPVSPLAKIIFAAIVLVIIIFVGLRIFAFATQQKLDRSAYQVVSLSSGQTFFGKLKNTSGEYLTLENPYTLQTLSGDSAENKSGSKVESTNGQTTLLKVSDQAYGPENSMAIKSSEVVFWQNLKADSKVSTAIKNKENQ